MAYLEDCEEIIIDLRENGGGYCLLTEEIFMAEEAEEAREVFRVSFRSPGGASTHVQLEFDDGRIIEFARKE